MKILIEGVPYAPEKDPEIATALWGTSQMVGAIPSPSKENQGFAIHGNAVDLYLLTATLAARIAVGDVELVEKGDKIHKRDYQQKLIREIQRDWCSTND